jgi:hypothetical protein
VQEGLGYVAKAGLFYSGVSSPPVRYLIYPCKGIYYALCYTIHYISLYWVATASPGYTASIEEVHDYSGNPGVNEVSHRGG